MVRVSHSVAVFLVGAVLVIVGAAGGCSANHGSTNFGEVGSSSGGTSSGSNGTSSGSNGTSGGGGASSGLNLGSSSSGAAPACTSGGTGWKCKVDTSCGSSSQTTLTGKVFDPAKKNPIYNVVVFVPNDPTTLPAITPGTHSCNTCDVSIGNYVTATQTNYKGEFTLTGVPTGMGVPVTVQVGKWRRTTTVNITKSCGTNTVADGTLHLPGKRSDGDMPQMALLTGGCDDLGCFLTGMGIDPSEFEAPPATLSATAPHSGGHVDVFQGTTLVQTAAAGLTSGTAANCYGTSCPLWASKGSFEYYDMALFSCECNENDQTKPTAGKQALHDWLNEGGKVFASHYQYTWFANNPQADFKNVANWLASGAANPGNFTLDIDNSFTKGVSMGQWMGVVGAQASAGPPPTISASVVATTVSTVNKTAPQATVRWLYDPSANDDTKYLSFGTPIGGISGAQIDGGGSPETKQYCGKAVFTDLHTSASLLSTVMDVPGGCMNNAGMLSPQQKALEFLFFDLSACVVNDLVPPPPPPMPM
jgi:hypothetical protein